MVDEPKEKGPIAQSLEGVATALRSIPGVKVAEEKFSQALDGVADFASRQVEGIKNYAIKHRVQAESDLAVAATTAAKLMQDDNAVLVGRDIYEGWKEAREYSECGEMWGEIINHDAFFPERTTSSFGKRDSGDSLSPSTPAAQDLARLLTEFHEQGCFDREHGFPAVTPNGLPPATRGKKP